MRIERLEIEHIRGIRHLILDTKGENIVVLGPNGSGKSTIVDAVDFLFTGRIGRLTGRGSGGLSLARHGPHISSRPEDAVVRARIRLPGRTDSFDIARCIGAPGELVCDHAERHLVEAALLHAERGQHVLTRRDILRFITAEPRDRAEAVQSVLDLSSLETIRQRLVRVRGDLRREEANVRGEITRSEARAAFVAGTANFNEHDLLVAINESRQSLGGSAVDSLEGDLRANLTPPAASRPAIASRDTVAELGRTLAELWTSSALSASDAELIQGLERLRALPDYQATVDSVRLVELGLEFVPDTGECPLCGASWRPGELHQRLSEKAREIADISQLLQDIETRAAACRRILIRAIAAAERLSEVAEAIGRQDLRIDPDLIAKLTAADNALSNPVEQYPGEEAISDLVQTFAQPDCSPIEDAVAVADGGNTPLQEAWDMLTRCEEALTALSEAQARHAKAARSADRADAVLAAFQEERSRILTALYDDVCLRFVDLYRAIHGPDEEEFSAALRPGEAGLSLMVDFRGRGQHPPHALHSEGHQDSMGLCLFLALAERLGRHAFDLIILDDVVMSVDADHRRHVAQLLAREFPSKQLIITTHDRTWAYQLKTSGAGRRQIEFYDWDLETGPHYQDAYDQWASIAEALEARDVSAAAAKLRRASEEFFSHACEVLEASVPYRADARWDLGALLPAAVSALRKKLREARQAAERWGNETAAEALGEMESVVRQIFARTQAEQWAVNPAVHYNRWAEMTPGDLQPVVEAFRDLFNAMRCSHCGGLYRVLKQNGRDASISCPCGALSATLVRP